MKKYVLLFMVFLIPFLLFPQSDTAKKEKIKTGWNFAGLPIVGFDTDMGFQYGLLGNAFHYGDGSTYPEYRHMFYVEVSRYTKGSGVNQFFYDSKYLIPWNIRLTADVSYLTEKALNFYGFNGYQASYFSDVEDDESEDYISRMYYRHDRKLLRVLIDFQKPVWKNKLRVLLGFNYFNIKTATVDIERLNKGKDDDKKLPDTALLYDDYIQYGLIKENEKSGGNVFYVKAGIIFDTRDNEPAPNKGVWTEAIFMMAPSFFGNRPYAFTKLAITHRQYITLVKEHLVFAYRLGYQATIGGKAPFYIQPYMYSSFARTTKPEGLGGARTLRGILRNRIVGDGIAFGSVELRWKIVHFNLFKQNFYIGLYGYSDGGQVVKEHPVDMSLMPSPGDPPYFDQNNDSFHLSYGLGLRIVMNQNFVLVFDYGRANDHRDGKQGFYLGLGNNF